MSDLAEVTFSFDELATCVERAEKVRKEQPATYAVMVSCVVPGKDTSPSSACPGGLPRPPAGPGVDDPDAQANKILAAIELGSNKQYQMETDTSLVGIGPFVHALCPSSTAPVPAGLPAPGATWVVSTADWGGPTWRCLKVSFEGPLAAQYEYSSSGTGTQAEFTATARRRLPGGKMRTIRLVGRGAAMGNVVRVSLTTLDE